MPRALTASFRRQVNAQYSGDVVLLFAEVSHPDLAVPVRIVSDTVSYVWNGNTWTGVMFDFQILSDGEGVPEAKVTIPNVDATLGIALAGMSRPPSFRFWILSSADFNLASTPRTPIGTPDIEYYA